MLGLSGTCRAQPGLGLTVSPPRAVGWQWQCPSCALLAAVAHKQCRCRKLRCPEPLMEWDETQELKQGMAQWATDSAFSCCSKLLPAAAYTVCSALQGMLFLMNVFLVQVVPVSDRAEGDTASLTKFRLKSDFFPHFPFTPSTLLSPKPRSSCFNKWFFSLTWSFAM